MIAKTVKKIELIFALVVIVAMILTACGAQPTAVPEQAATEAPVVEQPEAEQPAAEVEAPAVVEDTKMGGSIVFTHLEPATLNPYIRPDLEAWAAAQMVNKGLVDLDPKGNWVPILAEEIPALDKGTVSEDGLTVTWKLRPDLKWSDGEPLTIDDLIFTWEICKDASSGCAWNAGFDKIESITSEDGLTVVIKYKEFHPDFVGQFRNGILPKHGTGPGTNMLEWEWNRTITPGNGPFILKEWVPSDYLLFERNPNFYDSPKPYLDEVVWKIVPDFEVMRQMLLSGDADAMAFLSEPESIQEMIDQGFTVHGSNAFNNRLQLNPWDPQDLTKPHPILGDLKVRQAIFMVVDREAITYNWNIPGIFTTELFTAMFDMWPAFRCDIPAFPSDDAAGIALLEEAGWKDTDGDGFRECDGCTTAEQGTPMKLRVSSYSGWGMEDNEVVIIDELKKVGIQADMVNYEATVMYSSWADGSFMYRGDFDLLWWDDSGVMPDPQQRAMQYYHSSNIPGEQNPTGFNMSRINDPEIDAWIVAGGSTPDNAVRQENYCKAANKLMKVLIYEQHNGAVPYVGIANPRIQDWDANELYAPMGWDIANWWLAPE